jgi:hypothetical protein
MTANSLLPLHVLVENILNDEVPESPREAVLARVAAGRAQFAGNSDEVARQLEIARGVIASHVPFNWRDALRANVELGVHLVAIGRFKEAQPVLENAHTVLDKYFGDHNHGGRALIELIGACKRLNEGGCCGCGGCATEAKAAARA